MKYGFIGPALLLLIAMNIFPLLYNIYLSFTNADISGGETRSVGTANYQEVFNEPKYGTAIRTTALFTVLAVAIELVLGFTVALALHRNFPGKQVVLTILLIPMMLSPAVMALFWQLVLKGDYGILNQILTAFGWATPPQWLTDPKLKLASILMIDIWMWTPFMMLLSLAALNSIPKYIYEAAEIDRASTWTVFRRITLPLCAPLLMLAVLFRTTDAIKQFDFVVAVTGPNDEATQTLSALLFQVAFGEQKVGLGTAYGVVVLVAVIGLATVLTRYIAWIQKSQGKA